MAEEQTVDRTPEGGITITRTFDAPRERVWREWADPEAMDVRPGGSWRLTMFADPGRREIH